MSIKKILSSHYSFILLTFLCDHDDIHLIHIFQFKQHHVCKNISFSNYYLITYLDQLLKFIYNDYYKDDCISFLSSIDGLSNNEKCLITKFIFDYYEKKLIQSSNEENVLSYRKKKISFFDFCKNLFIRSL